MPGQRYDSVEVPPLIEGVAFDGLIADKPVLSACLGRQPKGRSTTTRSSLNSTSVAPASSSRSIPPAHRS